ncbi:MAG: ligase-associated DNA damage response endonuclease PdeM, partial [Phycisphaeraceae bacterium]
MIPFDWGGQRWELRPDRTIHWPKTNTLILADPHFGKAQHFRHAGIPVPTGTTQHNLNTLDQALNQTQANRLVVLGDFFHNRQGVTEHLLQQLHHWRQQHPQLNIINIRGNHDRQAGDPPPTLNISCRPKHEPDDRDPDVAFAHEPAEHHSAVTLAGHIHPGVRLRGKAKSKLRAPCFHFTNKTATLPAFGAFTGMKIIQPKPTDQVFALGPNTILNVSPSPSPTTSSPPTPPPQSVRASPCTLCTSWRTCPT